MIDFVNEELFRKDSINKYWTITGDNISLTNNDLYTESFDLSEKINSDNNIIFGSCVASVFKFTTSALDTDFKDKEITANVALDGDFENPFTLGTYVVTEETLSADKTKKEIVAYDGLYKIINTDVGPWYNALTFPMTLSTFRGLLFSNFGITQKTATLVNDNMTVEKTIDVNTLSGAEVVKAICEINGVFGHIDRNGLFEYKQLDDTSVYEITASMYSNCEYEEYEVQTIDRLQIREESGDIGVVVGSGTNDYIIEDNFLVYGKSSGELTTIANNILGVIDNVSFVPFKINCIGNPCVEVGDRVTITKRNGDSFDSYVLQRSMKGIQSLKDEITATGDEVYPDDVNGINYDIRQLKGKSNVLERTIEETRSTITDVEEALQTEIVQTAEGLQIQITDLQSQIDGETAYYERESGAPNLLNYPYWDFTTSIPCNNTIRTADIYTAEMATGGDQFPHFTYTEQNRKDHRSDLVYVDDTNLGYRFVLENGVWYWKEIADSEYTQILSRVSALEATAEQLTSEYTEISLDLSNNYYTKVETNSQISQTASQIQTTVAATYATKDTTNSLQSQITQQAGQIDAKVSQSGGSFNTFGWSLTSTGFTLYSQRSTVFQCNQNGITIEGSGFFSGNIHASSGQIGNWDITNGSISKSNGNYTVTIQADGTIACKQGNTVKWALQYNGDAYFYGNCTVNGYATASRVSALEGSFNTLNAKAITTDNLSAQSINGGQITGSSITGGKIAANTITIDKLNASSLASSRIDCYTLAASQSYIWVGGRQYSQTLINGRYYLTAPYQ